MHAIPLILVSYKQVFITDLLFGGFTWMVGLVQLHTAVSAYFGLISVSVCQSICHCRYMYLILILQWGVPVATLASCS